MKNIFSVSGFNPKWKKLTPSNGTATHPDIPTKKSYIESKVRIPKKWILPKPAETPMMANPYNAARAGIEDKPLNRYAIKRETKERTRSDRNVDITMRFTFLYWKSFGNLYSNL